MPGRRTAIAVILCVIGAGSTDGLAQQAPEMAAACAKPDSAAMRRACYAGEARGAHAHDARYSALERLTAMKLGVRTLSTERWVSIGPAPIVGGSPDTTWTARPRSGRVASIAVDPSNPKHWLIGTAGGGVWETFNAGASWAVRTDDQPALAIGALAFAPSDPNTVYAGTGEAVFGVDSYGGVGVLKSTDGGRTWAHLTSTTATFLNRSFSDLVVDPTQRNTVVAGVTWSSRPWQPATGGPPTGIYKTTNGGQHWDLKQAGQATAVEADPTNFNRQYAGVGEINGHASNGVYRSTDGGDAWRRLDGPWSAVPMAIGRVEIAIAPSDPNIVYVGIQDVRPTPNGGFGGMLGLWKSSDAWSPCDTTGPCPQWQPIPLGPTDDSTGRYGYCGWNPGSGGRAATQCYYNHELSVDPANPKVLFAGGLGLWRYDGAWREVALANRAKQIHADQHRIAWAGNRLVLGNDGGVWSTTNGGEDWDDHNTGLATLQFWGGAVAPSTPILVVGGTQDNGTAMWTPGGAAWTGIVRGDASAPTLSPSQPLTHWGIAAVSRGLEISRTVNGGTTLESAVGNLPTQVQENGAIGRPFVQCPANHDVVLFGDRRLYKTSNFFASRPAAPLWTDNSDPLTEPKKKLSSIAFAPSDTSCQTYAIGALDAVPNASGGTTPSGWLRITRDGGQTWSDLDPGRTLPQNRIPKGLAFDPRTPNTMFVVYSMFTTTPGGRVFRTANALAATPVWANVSPPVDFPHNSIALNPADPDVAWVGTDLGAWRGKWNAAAGAMTWTHFGPDTGLPNVVVSDVKVHAATGTPVAFTHGRGAFVLLNLLTWCRGNFAVTRGTNFGACP